MFKQIETVIELTKAGYKPIDHKRGGHYAAIGKLIVTVSTAVDQKLSSLLEMQVGSNELGVPRILVGDLRIGDVMSALKRIAESRKLSAELLALIDDLFFEIGELRHVRDIAAHRACMVKGNRFAFHNANRAKTDDAIDISFYTIGELNEFSAYAVRVGHRITALQSVLIPVSVPPRLQAALILFTHTLLAHAGSKVIKEKHLSRDQVLKLKELNLKSHTALKLYTAAVEKMDPDFAALQQTMTKAMQEFAVFLLSIDAPDDPSLREIPSRLRRTRRSQKRGTPQALPPRLLASPE